MATITTPLGEGDAIVYAPEPGEFDAELFRRMLPPGSLYGLDVETTATDRDGLGHWDPGFRVRLVQIATVGYAFVLDQTDPAQREAARELLADPATAFATHSDYDVLSVAVAFGIDITHRAVDTLILAILANPAKNADRDLKSLSVDVLGADELVAADRSVDELFARLWEEQAPGGRTKAGKTKVPPSKDALQKFGWNAVPQRDETYLRYAGLDAIVCRRLIEPLAAASGAPRTLLDVETWLAGAANRIKIRGVRLDLAAVERESAAATAQTDDAERRVAELTGGLKAASPKIKPWLAEHCATGWDDWTGPRSEKTQEPSFAKEAIFLLRELPFDDVARQVVEQLVRHRQVMNAKRTTDAVRAKLIGDRIHPTLKSIGTFTGRMSASEPNMQNVSKTNHAMRNMWVPDPGHVFVAADFKQIELRAAAAFSGEEAMIRTIIEGGDLHQLVADQLGITRTLAKTVNFLLLYGGTARKLSKTTGMPESEAQGVLERFWSTYPRIAELVAEMRSIRTNVVTVSGRRLPVPYFQGRADTHANINYLIQSSARDLLVDAWWRFDHDFGRGDLVWMPVHDELVMMVPEDQVEQVCLEIEKCMTFDFMGVPIAADVQVLRDVDGVSRWMDADRAEKIEKGEIR